MGPAGRRTGRVGRSGGGGPATAPGDRPDGEEGEEGGGPLSRLEPSPGTGTPPGGPPAAPRPREGVGPPEWILLFVLAFLLASVVFVLLVDLRDLFGIREFLLAHTAASPELTFRPVFVFWYDEGGPAEMLQWLMLGGSALVAAFLAGRAYGRDGRAFGFWSLMGLSFVLMLIEDAGNPRHTIRRYVQALFGEPIQGTAGTLSELVYFAVLGAIPLYALARYGLRLAGPLRARLYVLAGFVAYGLAVSLSFVGGALADRFDQTFYEWVGTRFYLLLMRVADDSVRPMWESIEAEEGWGYLRFMLVDGVVEESIELMGASLFFAGALTFLLALRRRSGEGREEAGPPP